MERPSAVRQSSDKWIGKAPLTDTAGRRSTVLVGPLWRCRWSYGRKAESEVRMVLPQSSDIEQQWGQVRGLLRAEVGRHRLLHLAEAARSGACRRRPGGDRGADPVHARLGRGPLCRPHPRPVDLDQPERPHHRAERASGGIAGPSAVADRLPAAPAVLRAPEVEPAAGQRDRGPRGAGRPARPALHLRDLRRRQAQRVRGGGRRARRRPRPSRRSTRCSSMAASASARPT